MAWDTGAVQTEAASGFQPAPAGGQTAPPAAWPRGRWAESRHVQIVLALTALAAALRFATLDVQSVWLDESATMILVHRSFAGMLGHLSSSESAPPLYYILVWVWTRVFGAGPLGFRSFSALVGTVTVPVMYLAGRRVSARVGVWTAALAAVSPALYYYSQEARCYGLLVLFSAIAFVAWQRALDRPGRRELAMWSIASALAVLTHYFAGFLFIAEALVLLRRHGLRRVIVPAGAVVAVGLALIPLVISQIGNGSKVGWIEETPLGSRLAETVKLFLVGVYGPLEIVTAALAGLIAAGAVLLIIRRGRHRERQIARDAAIVGGVAIAIPLLLAGTHLLDVFDGRNMLAAWIPSAMLVAIGVGGARSGRAGAAAGACVCAISLAVIAGINAIPGYQRDNWRGAARALPAAATARAIVSGRYSSLPLSIYLPRLRALSGDSVRTREIDFITLRTRRTGTSPEPPTVERKAPPGFRLAAVRKTETYAVSRFIAHGSQTVSLSVLREISGDPAAEVSLQR